MRYTIKTTEGKKKKSGEDLKKKKIVPLLQPSFILRLFQNEKYMYIQKR